MMNILITGAAGFVGKNLCASLKNIRDGKDRTRSGLSIGEIFEYDIDTGPELLELYCSKADFVFHLAGVNRPQNAEEFMSGNFGFTSMLLGTLKAYDAKVVLFKFFKVNAVFIYYNARFSRKDFFKSWTKLFY